MWCVRNWLNKQCQTAVVLLLASGLTACMVGPNFHAPAAPPTNTYTPEPTPAKTMATPKAQNAGNAQAISLQQRLPDNWWYLFKSEQINALVTQGLCHSPTLAAAKATLAQAQDTMQSQIGNLLFPAVDYNAQNQRLRTSAIAFGGGATNSVFSLYNTSLSVTYLLDVWGGSRRTIENLQAQVDYQKYEFLGAYLTLSANIVTTSVAIASLRDQITATQALIKDQTAILKIVQQQYNEGGVAYQDVLLQQTQLAQTQATLPPLKQALDKANHSLAVLVGNYTSEQQPLKLSLNQLTLPSDLPLSLPSQLVQQRPDIQASEALVHAATANVGVATANLLPQIVLSAGNGYVSTTLENFISTSNNIWNMGAALTQPVFHGGALWSARKAAIDALKAAAANYQQTVLVSFQNVADALTSIQQDAIEFNRQFTANNSAYQSMKIVQQQYKLGGVNYLTLLNAQEQYQQTQLALIKAQAARYADTVSLYQALGGGWWHDPTLTAKNYGVIANE